MSIWDAIESRLKISTQDAEVKKPTRADLDRFEAEFGFPLPDDYRDYALRFGPGELGRDEFSFRTPGFPGCKWADLTAFNQAWRTTSLPGWSDADLARTYGDAARARRFIWFCSVQGIGDQFAWDPADVTDPDRHDCGIYFIAHESNNPPTTRIASTFRAFVSDFVLGGGYRHHAYKQPASEWDELSQATPIAFTQASVRPRS